MDPFKRILLKVFHFAEYLHINIIRPQRSNFDLGEQTTLKSYGYSWGAIEYKVQSIKVAFENVANFIMVFYLQLLWKYFMLLIFLLFSFSRMSLWPKSDFSRNAGNLNRLDMGRAKTRVSPTRFLESDLDAIIGSGCTKKSCQTSPFFALGRCKIGFSPLNLIFVQ